MWLLEVRRRAHSPLPNQDKERKNRNCKGKKKHFYEEKKIICPPTQKNNHLKRNKIDNERVTLCRHRDGERDLDF
jgi:hypothetical protein